MPPPIVPGSTPASPEPKGTAPAVESPRSSRIRRNKAWNLTLAILFFILGVIGLVIPVMPQVLFFALSVFFLSLVSPTVRRWLRRFLRDHPKVAHAYKRWREKGRQKRREMIRRRKELARKMHLHREPEERAPGTES